jgi:hypothetical protein
MEIDDKGGEVVQRYEVGTRYDQCGEIDDVGHGHRQRGSNIKECKGIKILGQKKHTSRGEQAHELGCLHLVCAYSCVCLHCISF